MRKIVGVVPFWTSKTWNEVTKMKKLDEKMDDDLGNTMDGTRPSFCSVPCVSTEVSFF